MNEVTQEFKFPYFLGFKQVSTIIEALYGAIAELAEQPQTRESLDQQAYLHSIVMSLIHQQAKVG